MEITEIKGIPDYSKIINLINTEWPSEFGEVDDATKIEEMTKSHNENTDTIKYLFDNKEVIQTSPKVFEKLCFSGHI